jgi:serine/threonine-protein kinase
MRVSEAGGKPQEAIPFVEGHVTQRWPQVLRNGTILFTGHSGVDSFEDASLVAVPPGAQPRVVYQGGYYWQYVPSGHLLYVHDGTLFAVSFDVDQLKVTGTPVPLVTGVSASATSGGAQVSISESGTLAYIPGDPASASEMPLAWVDAAGKVTPAAGVPKNWRSLQLSPDGTRLAMAGVDNVATQIQIYDLSRQTAWPLTSGRFPHYAAIWSADGKFVVFSAAASGPPNLFIQAADGSRPAQRLTQSAQMHQPMSWHPDGRRICYAEMSANNGFDLRLLPVEYGADGQWKTGAPIAIAESPANEAFGTFSPDGKWLAYNSDEDGRFQIYVRPFPETGARWRVSTESSNFPAWSRTRNELVYTTLNGTLMVASYRIENGSFVADKPRRWKAPRMLVTGLFPFVLHPDGQRVLLSPIGDTGGAAKLTKFVVMTNVFDHLRRIAVPRQP